MLENKQREQMNVLIVLSRLQTFLRSETCSERTRLDNFFDKTDTWLIDCLDRCLDTNYLTIKLVLWSGFDLTKLKALLKTSCQTKTWLALEDSVNSRVALTNGVLDWLETWPADKNLRIDFRLETLWIWDQLKFRTKPETCFDKRLAFFL